ncbi:DUF5677 domain-containing protein [Gordonia sputi]
MGLASHTVDLAEAARDLTSSSSHSSGLVAMPLVRAAFEGAITAQWLVHVPDAIEAWVNEHSRLTTNLVKGLSESSSADFRDAAGDVERNRVLNSLPTTSTTQARKFNEMCEDLQMPIDAYTYFRLVSQYAHPSVECVDLYMDRSSSAPDAILLRRHARVDFSGWLHLLALSVLWAIAAASTCDKARRTRSEIQAYGRALSVEPWLKLSDQAWCRLHAN